MTRETKSETEDSSRPSKKIKCFQWTKHWPGGVTLDEWECNEYFMELFTHKDEVVKSFLLDWLAFIIQHDNTPIKRYLLIRDRSGGSLSDWFLQLITIVSLSLKFPVLIRTIDELESVKKGALVVLITNDLIGLDRPEWLKIFELRTNINVIILFNTSRKFDLVPFPYHSTFETSLVEVNTKVRVEAYAKNYLLKELMDRDITEFNSWIVRFLIT